MKKDSTTYIEGDEIPAWGGSKTRVEEFAKAVSEAGHYAIGGDLLALVELFGGTIHYQHLSDWIEESGSIFVHKENDFDIYLPQYTSPLRDRFTIGHELGHYFIHSNQGDIPLIAYRRGSGRREWEANWFAAELLMPAERFQQLWNDSAGDLSVVADEFQVSWDAAEVRGKALGLQ